MEVFGKGKVGWDLGMSERWSNNSINVEDMSEVHKRINNKGRK